LTFFAARDLLGNSQHHPPVQDDPQRPGDSRNNLALNLAKRDEVKPRLKLATCQFGD
jgi:hypothetical protein